MNAFSRSFANNASMAKKVVACSVAAALVASMSYFHLWGAPQAVADDTTVEVRFEIAQDDVTAKVGDKEFTSQTEEAFAVSVEDDLRFTVETDLENSYIEVECDLVSSADVRMGSKQPGDDLVTSEEETDASNTESTVGSEEQVDTRSPIEEGESGPEDLSETGVVQAIMNGETVTYETQAVSPIAETASVLAERHSSCDAGDPALDAAVDQEEVVEESETPLAEAAGGENESVIETAAIYQDDRTYIVDSDVLRKAYDENAIVVVKVIMQDAESVSSWDVLAQYLGQSDEAIIKLAGNIEAEGDSIVVKGTKTLDLNGHKITATTAESLFEIGTIDEPANFTLADSASEGSLRDAAGSGTLVPKPNHDNAGNLIEKDLGSFREQWVGRQASIDNNILTYYVTRSYVSKTTVGATDEYLIPHQVNLAGTGSIVLSNKDSAREASVFSIENSASVLNIKAGHVKAGEGTSRAVDMNHGGAFSMEGGFITGFTASKGAAVRADNQDSKAPVSVVIGGVAVVAGNKALENGGAVWANSTSKTNKATITFEGSAVVAGNVAGSAVVTKLEKKKIAETSNGGALYADGNCNVIVKGDTVISGNTAMADGGGVYVRGTNSASPANHLTISENAAITNNRSENDRSGVHPTDRSAKDHPAYNSSTFWQNCGGGGGGVFTQADTEIQGGQITGNLASDGGGGIFAVGGIGGYGYSLLKVEQCVIASNYAGTSEGGGINAATLKDSYIKAGYITNNMTATYYDYGGGGLFLSSADQGKTTGMTVYYPLVTGNTANGFGGGIGVCTNGIIVSSEAAVYGNKALEQSATQNPNEYGDQWLLESNLHAGELSDKDPNESRYGLKDKDLSGSANDFYCAKTSEVSAKMLGGGYYGWHGYTTGTVASGEVTMSRPDTGEKTVSFNGGPILSIGNILYEGDEKGYWTLHIPNELKNQAEGLVDAKFNYDTVDASIVLSENPRKLKHITGSGLVKRIDAEGPSPLKDQTEYRLFIDTTASNGYAATTKYELKQAFTRTEPTKTTYPLYEVKDVPQKENIRVLGNRLMFLTAVPDDTAIAAAEKKAVLFFSGNYSNTHGGGIACNDKIYVGSNPDKPWTPDGKTEPEKGSMEITKTLNRFDATSGSATAVFAIVGYDDAKAAQAHLEERVIYRTYISMTFGASAEERTAERLLDDLPEGYYVVDEEYYSGDNFKGKPNHWEGWVCHGETVSCPGEDTAFENVYSKESYGTGVANRYSKGDNDKFDYTPDTNYADRWDELTTEEGR